MCKCDGGERNGMRPFKQHVVLCKVRLAGAWIKRKEMVAGSRKSRSKKLSEHPFREGYARSLEGKEQNVMEIIISSICGSR